MAPRKTNSNPPQLTPPKSKPPGNGSTMNQAEKKARHSTSENNRLKNIKSGLADMLAMLPPEIRNIPGIEKNQTRILQAFGAEMYRQLEWERELNAENEMLKAQLQNDSQGNPADRLASNNVIDVSFQDVNTNSGNEPKCSTIARFDAHQTDNDLDFQQTISATSNFKTNPFESNRRIQPNNLNASNFSEHQIDNNLGFQPTNSDASISNSYQLDSTPGDYYSNHSNGPYFISNQWNNSHGLQPTNSGASNLNNQQINSTPDYYPQNCNSLGANFHQMDNNPDVQTNNMNFDILDQTDLDCSPFDTQNSASNPSNGLKDAVVSTTGY